MALKINCYIHPNKLYLSGISVSNKKSIGNLKSLILQKAPSLSNVKASGLLLYQAKSEINTAQDLDANVGTLFSNGEPVKEKLKPLRAISSLSSLQLHNLHVIAHIPPVVELPTTPRITLPAAQQMTPPNAPPTIKDVHEFLLSATLPSLPVTIVKSVATCPYTAVGSVSSNEVVPGFLTQDLGLLQRMHNDLVSNYLPRRTLIEPRLFRISESIQGEFTGWGHTYMQLNTEASVSQVTEKLIFICASLVRSLGFNYKNLAEQKDDAVNVIVDRLISQVNGGEVIAWEDKSPVVFQTHCTPEQIQCNAGDLVLHKRREQGFRAILFKLSLFMLKRKIRWGVLHDGRTMYVLRTERKQSKTGIVISSPLPMDATTGPTPIAIICYMMLSKRDNVSVAGPGIADSVSASSTEGHSGPPDDSDGNSNDDNGSNNSDNNNEIDNDDTNGKANDNLETGMSPNSESLLQMTYYKTNSVIVDLP